MLPVVRRRSEAIGPALTFLTVATLAPLLAWDVSPGRRFVCLGRGSHLARSAFLFAYP